MNINKVIADECKSLMNFVLVAYCHFSFAFVTQAINAQLLRVTTRGNILPLHLLTAWLRSDKRVTFEPKKLQKKCYNHRNLS